MFRKSQPSIHPDLFSNFDFHFKERKQNQLNDENAWHNVFYRHITSKVNESVFSVLYNALKGRPNASTRQLFSMLVLKEGYGWSDAQLFEECRFNILTMRALGMMNLNDEVPTESTYYLFKHSLYDYQRQTGQDLVSDTFASLTQGQAQHFGVVGDRIRMDSKLIGSNIATCCRLQLIVNCLSVFWQSLDGQAKSRIDSADQSVLEEISQQKSHQYIYGLSNDEKSQHLEAFGVLLCRLQEAYTDSDSDHYGLLVRLLQDQYTVQSKTVLPKASKDISSTSLQSVDDVDATYRKKGDQKVKGYSANLTETCNEEGLNMVTDVKVKPANAPDNKFVQQAIESTEDIVGQVKEVSMDGAYNDGANTEYAQEEDKKFHYTGIQGAKGRFIYERTEQGVEVTDRKTGEVLIATQYKIGKYKIITDDKTHYFTVQDIDNYIKRKQIEDLAQDIKNRRNNVEASIFQLSFHTRKGKTRYRGLFKHQLWAFCRSLWMNLIRIKNYLAQPAQVPA